MNDYDRDKLQRIFDEPVSTRSSEKQQDSVVRQVSDQAFRRLMLTGDDVLLDMGCGFGYHVLAAARVCQHVVGIDISRKSLDGAQEEILKEDLKNVTLIQTPFEEPGLEQTLMQYNITKILAVYSLHHLPDELKNQCLNRLISSLPHLKRIVIGDLIFFENPSLHIDQFDEIHYDGGETDFPAYISFLERIFKKKGAVIDVDRFHPLCGVVTADFRKQSTSLKKEQKNE